MNVPSRRLLALAALLAVLLPPLLSALGWEPVDWSRRVFSGAAFHGQAAADFSVAVEGGAGPAGAPLRAAVRADDPDLTPFLWGSYVGGKTLPGRFASSRFRLEQSFLYVPIMGYPTRPGNQLSLEVFNSRSERIAQLDFREFDPGQALGIWRLDIRGWRHLQARLVWEGGRSGREGWIGVGAPIFAERSGYRLPAPDRGRTNYGYLALAAFALTGLLFLPGYALRVFRPRSSWAESALAPVLGMILLASVGLVSWLGGPRASAVVVGIYLCAQALAGLILVFFPGGSSREHEGRRRPPVGSFYAALVGAVLAVSVIRLPVAQEFFAGSTFQARMVASPPDTVIPYVTAAFMKAGYPGSDSSNPYFGPPWSIASRGPLAPLMILGGFDVFQARPADPPNPSDAPWPAATDGFYLARLVGVLTNACMLFGAEALWFALAGREARGRPALLVWLCLAPVCLINVAFLWPKLLAAYFLCLAAADILERRSEWRVAAWIGLAFLSHPVGGLFAPALALLHARTCSAPSEASFLRRSFAFLSAGGRLAAKTLVVAGPWLAYKFWLNHPDVFFRYPLGDGRGFAAAASAKSWLLARWDNLDYTFIPGTFFFSGNMRTWSAPLSPALRWVVQSAKSLPAGLGFTWCWMSYAVALGLAGGAWRRRETAVFARWCLLPAALIMLVYWGFSSDGLGRDCLEPLSIAVLVWTAASWAVSSRALRILAPLLWLETVTLVAVGFAGAEGFSLTQVGAVDAAMFGLFLAAAAWPVALALRKVRGQERGSGWKN